MHSAICSYHLVVRRGKCSLGVALLDMAIRVVLVKDGEVRGGCAGKNPMMQEEGVACTMCGALPAAACKSED